MEIKRARILGNGVSRTRLNPKAIYPDAPLFACNAEYRNHKANNYENIFRLVALDEKIVAEINESDFPKEKFYVPSFENQFEPAEFNPNRPRENSGMVAMNLAIDMGYNELICIGFDFLVENNELSLQNIYEGTPGYGAETRSNLRDIINRVKYFEWFANKHPHVTFVLVYPDAQLIFRKVAADNVYGEIR